MRRILSFAALALFAIAPIARAQRNTARNTTSSSNTPIELGLDGGLNFGMGGQNNATVFNLNLSHIRVGFLVAPQLSLEPSVALSSFSNSGGSTSAYMLGLGALYHFSEARALRQFYARPFVNLIGARDRSVITAGGTTTTVTTSSTLYETGAGFGVKIPYQDRMSWRLETNLSHNSKKYIDDSDNRLGFLFGFSYFTH